MKTRKKVDVAVQCYPKPQYCEGQRQEGCWGLQADSPAPGSVRDLTQRNRVKTDKAPTKCSRAHSHTHLHTHVHKHYTQKYQPYLYKHTKRKKKKRRKRISQLFTGLFQNMMQPSSKQVEKGKASNWLDSISGSWV